MIALIQAHPLAAVLIAGVVGAWIGMFAVALFRVAGESDQRGDIV